MYRYETHLHTSPVSACARASVYDSLVAYKELELNVDGTVKTVKVASQLTSNITKANNYSSLVFATVDAAGTWTTDSATSAVNGWLKAADGNGNVIYYK